MKPKIFVVVVVMLLLLTACNRLPNWKIADQGGACTLVEVIDKSWPDGSNYFYLLLKAGDGQIGLATVNAYVYDSLQIGESTCVTR